MNQQKKSNNEYKAMKRGILEIKIDGANKYVVECHLDNGTIWMDRNELCELFGCYMKDINQCLGEIFQKNMLRVEETCKYHIIAGGRRISYDITAVNLAIIITLAFRLETPEARTLQMWFVEQLSKTRSFDIPFPDIGENFRLN